MKPKIPKDLGLKIGSETEVLWTNVKKNTETEIKTYEDALLVNKELLSIAEKKIKIEKEKTKKLIEKYKEKE